MGRGIFIALGANLPGPEGEEPLDTLQKALFCLEDEGVQIQEVSPVYESPPWPPSDQPWYVNAVAKVETALGPEDLLKTLLKIEGRFGRLRAVKNAPRSLDLDIIDFKGKVHPNREEWQRAMAEKAAHGFFLPHLRAHERDFVLKPLLDISPAWGHPVFSTPGEVLLKGAAKGKTLRPAKGGLKKP